MSIEFPCSQCGKLLRVGDDAAGKQARCPSCGAVQEIPASAVAGQNPFNTAATPPFSPSPHSTEVNPYQAPASAPWYPGAESHLGILTRGPIQPTPIDAGDVLNRTWEIFKVQFWMITLAAFIVSIISGGFGMVVGQIVTPVFLPRGGAPPTLTTFIMLQVITQIPGLLFGTWLEIGLASYMLKIARGESPSLGELFAGGRLWPSAVMAKLLYLLACYVGFALLIVPGIIVALMFSQYMYLIIDRNQGPLQSLATSQSLTAGSKLNLFVLAVSTIGVGLLGVLACCVGVFPAAGFIALMWAVAYLAMTGQPITDAHFRQTPTPQFPDSFSGR